MKLKNILTNIRTKIIIKKTWLFTVGHYNEKSSPSSFFLFHNNNNKKITTTTTNILINMKINVNDYCFSFIQYDFA